MGYSPSNLPPDPIVSVPSSAAAIAAIQAGAHATNIQQLQWASLSGPSLFESTEQLSETFSEQVDAQNQVMLAMLAGESEPIPWDFTGVPNTPTGLAPTSTPGVFMLQGSQSLWNYLADVYNFITGNAEQASAWNSFGGGISLGSVNSNGQPDATFVLGWVDQFCSETGISTNPFLPGGMTAAWAAGQTSFQGFATTLLTGVNDIADIAQNLPIIGGAAGQLYKQLNPGITDINQNIQTGKATQTSLAQDGSLINSTPHFTVAGLTSGGGSPPPAAPSTSSTSPTGFSTQTLFFFGAASLLLLAVLL